MTTTDTTLLIILTVLLSIYFLLGIAAMVIVLKLLSTVKRVVGKAEDVVDSVESATEVFKDTQGRLALFKLIRNIYKVVQRKNK